MKNSALALLLAACAALVACGDKNAAPAPEAASAPTESTPAPAATPTTSEAPAAAAPAEAAVAENAAGKKVYGATCSMCHAAGVAGAPKPGDKADWAPRIAQGMDTLYKHAIEGFTGAKGMMPAKGGNTALSDDDVKAAVDHMVALSR